MKMSHGNMIENEKCYICLENLDGVYTSPLYNHGNRNHLKCGCLDRYHRHCLNTWLSIQNKCPICKKKINETENMVCVINNNNNEINYHDDDFELEVDDNYIFYNPLVYFIFVYIVYLTILLSINYFIYNYFLK